MTRPAPKHAPRIPFALLLIGLVVGGLAVLLGLNTASAANELRRYDLVAKDDTVAAQVQQLRDEIAQSRAPGNLARAAAQLGMVPAGNPAFLKLLPDGSATVLGRPSAVPTPAAPVVASPTKAQSTKAHSTAAKKSPAKKSPAESSSTHQPAKTPPASSASPTPTRSASKGAHR